MPAVLPCLTRRRLASPDQRLRTLYLPGAELTLHASVHGARVSEHRRVPGRSQPRPKRHVKPHPNIAYKG